MKGRSWLTIALAAVALLALVAAGTLALRAQELADLASTTQQKLTDDRESYRQGRIRAQEHADELAGEITELEMQNESMRQVIERLEQDNHDMEVRYQQVCPSGC